MIYQQIINKYGKEHQILKAVEELTELSLALQHYFDGKTATDAVVNELVDVEIMLIQLKIIFEVSEETITKIKRQKLEKLNLDDCTEI